MIWQIAATVFLSGRFGGLINGVIAGELKLPYIKKGCHVLSPGIIGNIIVGGAAALLFWGLYSPFADEVIFGAQELIQSAGSSAFTLGDLINSIAIGTGGGRLLTTELDRKCLQRNLDFLESGGATQSPS